MTSFIRDGAESVAATLLPERANIQPFPGERPKPSMDWSNWNEALLGISEDLRALGLGYVSCRLAVSYYLYANRGNRNDPQMSRSQAIVSEWGVSGDAAAKLGYPEVDCNRLTAFFPVYDGIGFWIGKRRRETGEAHYTPGEEQAIAKASAIGAMGVGMEFASPQEPGHMVYRCVWAPGKAFDGAGNLIPNSTNLSFIDLGFSAAEISRQSETNGTMPFRLFGDCRIRTVSGDVVELPFTTQIAEALHGAWKQVNLLPNRPDPPKESCY